MARDGLYKGLPMDRPWKAVVKHVEREADSREVARRAAEEALLKEARRELSDGFMRALIHLATEADFLPGLPLPQLAEQALRPLAGVSPLACELIERLYDPGVQAVDAQSFIAGALAGALEELKCRRFRQAEEYCRGEGASKRILDDLANAVLGADEARVAGQLIGQRPAPRHYLPAIDLDGDDLARPL